MHRPVTLILCALLSQAADAGERVYLCRQNGKVTYTATSRFGECRPVNLKVSQPSQEELDRLAREKEKQEAEQKVEEQQAREERQVRAQEEAAKAAKRQARAAEKQAEYEREQLRAQEEANALERNRQPAVIFVPHSRFPHHPVTPPSPKQPDVKIDLKVGGNRSDKK